MPFKTFDVDIERNATESRLTWPLLGEGAGDGYMGGNKYYYDLGGMRWEDLRRVLELEKQLLVRLSLAADRVGDEESLDREMRESGNLLYGLDIGVASTVIALSAADCLPFSSCNGGALGGSHHEEHPLVAFYARPAALPILNECAERAGVGLDHGDEGYLLVYGNSLATMRLFAEEILHSSQIFDELRAQCLAHDIAELLDAVCQRSDNGFEVAKRLEAVRESLRAVGASPENLDWVQRALGAVGMVNCSS